MKTKYRKSREAGQHGVRKNGKLAKFLESKAQERYEARKANPAPAIEIDNSWMLQVPTGTENH